MGRGVHCTLEKRKLIWNLFEKGTNKSKIAELLDCSRKMVHNAIKLIQADKSFLQNSKIRKPPPRKTTPRLDKIIVRKCKADAFKSSNAIMTETNEEHNLDVSSRLVRRRLNEANLYGRTSRKKPLLTKKNIKARLTFAKLHQSKDVNFWKRVLWSDETKINRIGPDGKSFVHRPKNQAYNSRYTKKTVKHGGGSVMAWGAFSWYGVGPLVRINGKMDKHIYLDILKSTMEPFAFENMPVNWIFMQDNDPKHSSKVVKEWFNKERVEVLSWPAQSPDLNPIENLWNDVKVKIGGKNFKNADELWEGIKKEWNSIPVSRCRTLVESMSRRCDATIKSCGQSTKY